jgi:hypothetical protein
MCELWWVRGVCVRGGCVWCVCVGVCVCVSVWLQLERRARVRVTRARGRTKAWRLGWMRWDACDGAR